MNEISPARTAEFGGHFFAMNCTKADTIKILAMVVPLTNGPCQGMISLTKDGANDANKLKDAKALKAVKPAI